MTPVLTVTLNPALDLATAVDRIVPDDKLRCAAPSYDPGGGGINVSRVIRELGGETRAIAALGGPTGARLEAILSASGLDFHACRIEGETRFSFMVADRATGENYRFVLPGPAQSPDGAARLLAEVGALARAARPAYAVLSGSLPPGVPGKGFAALAAELGALGARVILDSSGPAMRAALSARPYLIKPNLREARELFAGSPLEQGAAPELARRLLQDGAAEIVIITLGGEGAIAAAEGTLLRLHAPQVATQSRIGAGDSFVGALVLGLARGWPLAEACRYGLAAGTSAVMTPGTSLCERAATERFFDQLADAVEPL